MDKIIDKIKDNRPNLTASSLKTYKSILQNIYKNVYPDCNNFSFEKFNNANKILEHLKDLEFNKRKTKLAPLYVLTGNPAYSEIMNKDISIYNEQQDKQEKTPYFEENMISSDEVFEKYKQLEVNALHLMKKKEYTKNDLQEIQKCILLALAGGIFNPPRRSSDWIMKYKNIGDNDNYIDLKNNLFVFKNYKTAKVYGTQTIEINKDLKKLLSKWIKIIPKECDYILFDSNLNPLTNSQITHRLNNIFGKKISTSLLRHIYLTSKFSHVDLQDLKDTAESMGNSPLQALKYVKKDRSDSF